MNRILYLALALFVASPALMSCREEKEVEVEQLKSDVSDGTDEEGYDTNPTEEDPD
ncbi:hypothetical protein [Nonlabens spongiae]|uniref:hypothetical protein n=1 Tax=Nonlabens spongiae TaxID=331648 RepID=UPI0012F51241|nr:hypothetical protein [Nonlabens spongiae]